MKLHEKYEIPFIELLTCNYKLFCFWDKSYRPTDITNLHQIIVMYDVHLEQFFVSRLGCGVRGLPNQ